MYNKFLGKILSQIYKKSGYILIITMMLAAPMITQAADNFPTVTSVFQQITVTGTVTDSQGETLPGVTIMVKGTTAGVVTNIEGRFSITVPDEDAVLVFSFIGFETQEIRVGNNRVIDVSLGDEATRMDELVVTGYMALRRESLTGSIATIGSQELTETKTENVVNAMAGRLPGVRISQKNARPGSYETFIDIRGYSGTENNTQIRPLFVVDGVPRDQDYFARMDPEEIENISILKDGSAAVYGMRAANGVVLITTKSGVAQQGKVDITYSGRYTWQTFLNVPRSYTPVEFFTLRNEQHFRSFGYENFFKQRLPLHDAEEIDSWRGVDAVDWIDLIFRKVTPETQHNLSVNGGNESIRYFFSMGYTKTDGNFTSGSLWSNRFNLRSNIDAQITPRLKTRVSLAAILDNVHEPGDAGWTTYKNAWLHRPTSTPYANNNPLFLNGDIIELNDGVNSIAQTDHTISGYNYRQRRRMDGGLTLTYDIPGINGLQAEAFYNYSLSNPDNKEYRRLYYLYTYNSNTNEFNPTANQDPSRVTRNTTFTVNTNMQLRLRYNMRHGAHRVNSVFVFEEQSYASENFSAYRELFVNSEHLVVGENNANQRATGSMPVERASQSFIGQFSYGFSEKYLVDFNFRYEGSSKWPKESRWGFFPSIALAWRLSEESFIQNLNFDYLSNLKIRASYGQTGDDSAGGNYPPIFTNFELRPNDNAWYFNGSGGSLQQGARPSSLPNPTLTWYKAIFKNVALDFGFFREKLTGTFELFQRDRSGLLATSSADTPNTVGATMPQRNMNADRHWGWEIDLAHRNRIGDVGYQVSGQFSATRSMRTKWLETVASNSMNHWRNASEGRYNEIWWAAAAGGEFQSIAEIRSFDKYPIPQGALPGDWWFVDWNGDGIVQTGSGDTDRYPYATQGLANFNYGISASANYKGFDLSMHFQGVYKINVAYSEVLTEALPFGQNRNGLSWFTDRWHPVDPSLDWWHHDTQYNSGWFPVTGGDARRSGSNNIHDCSYLRLKTLEIGYTLPTELLTRVKIKNLRVYVNAYNLLTFTKLKDFDPERPGGTTGVGTSTNSVDIYQYPNNRTFSIGTSIKF